MISKRIAPVGGVDSLSSLEKLAKQRFSELGDSGDPVKPNENNGTTPIVRADRAHAAKLPDYRIEEGVFSPTFPYKRIVDALADFFSNPAVTAAGEWQIFLPLADGILPNTRLAIFASPFQCMLRFTSQNPEVTKVLSQHQVVFCDRLKAIFPKGTDVTIDF